MSLYGFCIAVWACSELLKMPLGRSALQDEIWPCQASAMVVQKSCLPFACDPTVAEERGVWIEQPAPCRTLLLL